MTWDLYIESGVDNGFTGGGGGGGGAPPPLPWPEGVQGVVLFFMIKQKNVRDTMRHLSLTYPHRSKF